MSRWDNFTPTELIVINEALNTAFESDQGSWDNEAQKIAVTLPPCNDEQIIDQLNAPEDNDQ